MADAARDVHRKRGNELYVACDFQGAIAEYDMDLAQSPNVLSFSNKAQCLLNLKQYDEAEKAARSALEIEWTNAKARYRFAAAHKKARNDPEESFWQCLIAWAVYASQTSGQNLSPDNQVWTLLQESLEGFVSSVADDDWPAVARLLLSQKIECVKAGGSPSGTAQVAVLGPGQHKHSAFSGCRLLIGVDRDRTTLVGESGSPIAVTQGGATLLCNMTILETETKRMPVVGCCGNNVRLFLAKCYFPRCHSGALACRGSALFARKCVVENTTGMAIEIREGASATLSQCSLRRVFQGVCAYNGARSIKIGRCNVEEPLHEGFLLCGTKKNESTRIQENVTNERCSITCENDLSVVLTDCTVRYSPNTPGSTLQYALSVDLGAQVSMSGCDFLSAEMGVFVKGGSGLVAMNSRFVKSNKAVCVGANYDGEVIIARCIFVSCGSDIVEEATLFGHQFAALGWSSKPTVRSDNKSYSIESRDTPTIEHLRQEASASLRPVAERQDENRSEISPLSRCVLFNHYSGFYPIGNSTGVMAHVGSFHLTKAKDEPISFYFGGCGDIRNLLSCCEAAADHEGPLRVQMVDLSLRILARDIALIKLVSDNASVETVVAVWGNYMLNAEQHGSLCRALQSLIDANGAINIPWLALSSEETMRLGLRSVWEDWLLDYSPDSVLRRAEPREKMTEYLPKNITEDPQFATYIETGSLSLDSLPLVKINTTLLHRNGEYRCYETSCIFRAVPINPERGGGSLSQKLCASVQSQIQCLRKRICNHSIRIIFEWNDLIKSLMLSSVKFDHVDVSNCGDYLSLPSVLAAASPALASTHAIITAHTMRENGRELDALFPGGLELWESLTGLKMSLCEKERTVRYMLFSVRNCPATPVWMLMNALAGLKFVAAAREGGTAASFVSPACVLFAAATRQSRSAVKAILNSKVAAVFSEELEANCFRYLGAPGPAYEITVPFKILEKYFLQMTQLTTVLNVVLIAENTEKNRWNEVGFDIASGKASFFCASQDLLRRYPDGHFVLQMLAYEAHGAWVTTSYDIAVKSASIKPAQSNNGVCPHLSPVDLPLPNFALAPDKSDWSVVDFAISESTLTLDIIVPENYLNTEITAKVAFVQHSACLMATVVKQGSNEQLAVIPVPLQSAVGALEGEVKNVPEKSFLWKRMSVVTLFFNTPCHV